jgi:hypothetical protein
VAERCSSFSTRWHVTTVSGNNFGSRLAAIERELPGADLYMFLSNEAEIIGELRAFGTSVAK